MKHTDIILERKPPRHLEHFRAINDLRIAAELTGDLRFFFAHWELHAAGWRHALIPDAVLAIVDRTFAVEIDRGGENLQYFARTKIVPYFRGLEGFPLTAVLIVVERPARINSLARAISCQDGKVLFTMTDLVSKYDFRAPIFFSEPHAQGVPLV